VSHWSSGIARPKGVKCKAIEIACSIPVDAWSTDDERAQLDVLRQRVAESEHHAKTGTEG
jgi:hypothetical protein